MLRKTEQFWAQQKCYFETCYFETFECYFERYIFDSIKSSGRLVQKLSSEQPFLKTAKQNNSLDSWSIVTEFFNGNKNEKIVIS